MNLDVVKVDPELNMIACAARCPPQGRPVTIRSTAKTIIEKKGEAGTSAKPAEVLPPGSTRRRPPARR